MKSIILAFCLFICVVKLSAQSPLTAEGLSSFAHIPPSLSSHLIVHYKMNDNTMSQKIVDGKGLFNAMAARSTSYIHDPSGRVGGALKTGFFNGYGYIDAGVNYASVLNHDFSISIWFKAQDGIPSYGQYLFGQDHFYEVWSDGPVGPVHHTYQNGVDISLSDAGKNRGTITAWYSAGDSAGVQIGTTNIILVDGQEGWHNVTLTAGQVGANITVTLYFDAALLGGIPSNPNTFAGYITNYNCPAVNFILGQTSIDGYVCEDTYFEGSLDNMMIFNKVLTTSEVKTLYNNGNGAEW
jgi:hypothetical protein